MAIQDYVSAAEYLGHKVDRPLPGRSSRLVRHDDRTIAVRYHNTDVVTYTPEKTILNSAGFRTMTTKARMQEYAPVRLMQERGLWYVKIGPGWEKGIDWKLYQDGLTVADDGTISGYTEGGAEEARKRSLDRKVSAYIKAFCASVEAAKTLESPSSGDCFGCAMMRDTSGTLVEALGYDHYLEHMKEGYFVPSLVWRAVQDRGNPGFCYQLIQARAKAGDTGMLRDSLRSFFRRIKSYLLAEMGGGQ